MLTVVVGQTFHGSLASAPIDQTPKRERPNVVSAPNAVARRAARAPEPRPLPADGPDRDRAELLDGLDDARADVLDRRRREAQGACASSTAWARTSTGASQMTDWDDAPVLADKSLTRRIGGASTTSTTTARSCTWSCSTRRRRDYWVVNTLLDRLSNETMIAIAKGLRPLGSSRRASRMRVAVFGAGYVGLVTGACFADLGHDVVVRDIVEEKIDALRARRVPIHEEGLDELLERNARAARFTTDVERGGRRTPTSSTSPSARRRPTRATPTCRPSGRSSTSCRRSTDGSSSR